MTKTDLIFPAFSSRLVDFAVQFCFRCKFSFNEERRSDAPVRFDSDAIFLDQSHFFATHTATNEIASFWMDHRSRQMAFFRAKAGQKAAVGVILRYFQIQKAFRYYIKQIDSMLPCV